MTDSDGKGYGKPPKANRFKKGQSGNPNGRPKNLHKEPPYEAILGQQVTITENGIERQTTAEEAFLKALMKLGADGNVDAAIALSSALEEDERLREIRSELENPPDITVVPVPKGSVSHHLRRLKIVRKLYAKQPHAKQVIENWAVTDALERLDGRQLSLEEQQIVVAATHRPEKMKWPDWWEANRDS